MIISLMYFRTWQKISFLSIRAKLLAFVTGTVRNEATSQIYKSLYFNACVYTYIRLSALCTFNRLHNSIDSVSHSGSRSFQGCQKPFVGGLIF